MSSETICFVTTNNMKYTKVLLYNVILTIPLFSGYHWTSGQGDNECVPEDALAAPDEPG